MSIVSFSHTLLLVCCFLSGYFVLTRLKLFLLSILHSLCGYINCFIQLLLLLDFICYNGYDQIYVGSGSCCDPDSVCNVENPNESAFCKKTTTTDEEQCVGTGLKVICLKNWVHIIGYTTEGIIEEKLGICNWVYNRRNYRGAVILFLFRHCLPF